MSKNIIIFVMLLSLKTSASSNDRWSVSGFCTIGGVYNDNSDIVHHTLHIEKEMVNSL